MLYDIGIHIQKAPLVFDGNQGAFGTVIFGHLQGFDQRAARFDIALNTHVT